MLPRRYTVPSNPNAALCRCGHAAYYHEDFAGPCSPAAFGCECQSFVAAVLPTADAPTAERIVTALRNAVDAQTPNKTWLFKPKDAEVLSWLASRLPSLLAADADRQRMESERDEARWEASHLRRIVQVAVAQCESICNDGSNRFATHCANLVLSCATVEATNIANGRAARSPEGEPND